MLWRIRDDVCKLLRKSCVRVYLSIRGRALILPVLSTVGGWIQRLIKKFSNPINQNLSHNTCVRSFKLCTIARLKKCISTAVMSVSGPFF